MLGFGDGLNLNPKGQIFLVLRSAQSLFVMSLLNLMDAITYGAVFFPPHLRPFDRMTLEGVSMHLLATAASQLILPRGSAFERLGVAGSTVIENIPFYQAIAGELKRIAEKDEWPQEDLISTCIAAMSLVSAGTSLAYLLLTLMDFDHLMHQIPRSVLVGMMGGIGGFLIITGWERVLGEPLTMKNYWLLITDFNRLGVWMSGAVLAALMLVVERRVRRSRNPEVAAFIVPTASIGMFIVFYLAFAILNLVNPNLFTAELLRTKGWLVKLPVEVDPRTWNPLSIYQLLFDGRVHLSGLLLCLPMILLSVLFSIFQLGINAPALARSLGVTFSLKKESFLHAQSNALTSLLGMVPTCLSYTNSLLLARTGGVVGYHRPYFGYSALSMVTLGVLWWGVADVVEWIPTPTVLFILFYLAGDLELESIISIWRIAPSKWEIIFVVWPMTLLMCIVGFGSGLLYGLIVIFLGFLIMRRMTSGRRLVNIDFIPFEFDSGMFKSSPLNNLQMSLMTARILEILQLPDSLTFLSTPHLIGHFRLLEEKPIVVLDCRHLLECDLNGGEVILSWLRRRRQNCWETVLIGPPRWLRRIESDLPVIEDDEREFGKGRNLVYEQVKDFIGKLNGAVDDDEEEEVIGNEDIKESSLLMTSSSLSLTSVTTTTGIPKRIHRRFPYYEDLSARLHDKSEPFDIDKLVSMPILILVDGGVVEDESVGRVYYDGSWIWLDDPRRQLKKLKIVSRRRSRRNDDSRIDNEVLWMIRLGELSRSDLIKVALLAHF